MDMKGEYCNSEGEETIILKCESPIKEQRKGVDGRNENQTYTFLNKSIIESQHQEFLEESYREFLKEFGNSPPRTSEEKE